MEKQIAYYAIIHLRGEERQDPDRIMKILKNLFPILLAILVFIFAVIFLRGVIELVNHFPTKTKIVPIIFIGDVLVGLTIYIKTSIDFALFIGNLMSKNSGVKNRIAIETGTALGNAIGTIAVLIVWTFFKEVPVLLIVAIVLASFILLQLANEGLNEYIQNPMKTRLFVRPSLVLLSLTGVLGRFASPITRFLVSEKNNSQKTTSFLGLFIFSITIPFALGLDDFAGYIPLFTIVNVFGFSIGAFLGHMFLNIGLFASPNTTIRIVKFPAVRLIGSLVFILIAIWGFIEAGQMIINVWKTLH